MKTPSILPVLFAFLFGAFPFTDVRGDDITTITILHVNDLHAHVEPVVIKEKSYAGYARLQTAIASHRKTDPNPLFLCGGDIFQGTLYFNVYEGLASLYFLNRMGLVASAVGNHEFDRGPEPLGTFARHADFPLLACNLDLSEEPHLKGIIRPHVVIERGGRKVGLIGAVTPDLPLISAAGKTVRMIDLETSLKKSIDDLTGEGVGIIIFLSHLGFPLEKKIASRLEGIDVIVGGHSHTFLGESALPGFPEPAGPYPSVVDRETGGRTLLLSAWEWGIVLGRIQVDFDGPGKVVAWRGSPVVIDETVVEDPFVVDAILAFRRPIEALRNKVVTTTREGFDADRDVVRRRESPLADLIADGMLAATRNAGAKIAIVNGGGVRRSIEPGKVSYKDLIEVQPFGSTLVVLDLSGKELLEALEHGVSRWEEGGGCFPQVSHGLAYTFDLSKPPGQRLVKASVDGEPIASGKTYRAVLSSFIASGGDGYSMFAEATGFRVDTGLIDSDATIEYLEAHPGIQPEVEGRITILNEPK